MDQAARSSRARHPIYESPFVYSHRYTRPYLKQIIVDCLDPSASRENHQGISAARMEGQRLSYARSTHYETPRARLGTTSTDLPTLRMHDSDTSTTICMWITFTRSRTVTTCSRDSVPAWDADAIYCKATRCLHSRRRSSSSSVTPQI